MSDTIQTDSSIGNDTELRDLTLQILDLVCDPVTFVRLRRLFLLLTRAHFSSADNYGEYTTMLACRTYDLEDPTRSSLQVNLQHSFDENSGSQQPAVYVGLADGRFLKDALNDFIGHSDDRATTYSTKTAQTQIRFTFIDREPDLALALAETMACFVESLRSELMQRMSLHSLDLVDMSEIASRDARPEDFYRVDMRFNIQFAFSTAKVEESHRLKKMAQRITLNV